MRTGTALLGTQEATPRRAADAPGK